MPFRHAVRDWLARHPAIDARFRRHVWSRVHFPEPEMRFVAGLKGRPISVAVDVGAALGNYAWLLNRVAGRVIAFEPGATHADFMARALANSRIELRRQAVGAECGRASLMTPGDDKVALHSATLSTANPVVAGQDTVVTDVDLTTLDAAVLPALRPGETVDFIKIDVEGFELAALQGARALIARDHPLVLCEIEARHSETFANTFGFLEAMGYQALILDDRWTPVSVAAVRGLQTPDELEMKLAGRPSRYFNNFLFRHPLSKLTKELDQAAG